MSFGMSWPASVLAFRGTLVFQGMECRLTGLRGVRQCPQMPLGASSEVFWGPNNQSHTKGMSSGNVSSIIQSLPKHTQGSIIIMMPIFTEFHSVLKALYTQHSLAVKNLSYWTQIFTPPMTEESSANHLTSWSLSLLICKTQANNILHLHKFGESSLQSSMSSS